MCTLTSLCWGLSSILTIWQQNCSLLHILLRMILTNLQHLVNHPGHDVWLAYQVMQDSHFWNTRELLGITRSIIITTGSSVQYPSMCKSILPQPDCQCQYPAWLIQYSEHLCYYCIVCCSQSDAWPTHFICIYEYGGIWWIMKLEHHFCALIVVHFHIHVENIHIICKKHPEPPLQMMTLASQRTK